MLFFLAIVCIDLLMNLVIVEVYIMSSEVDRAYILVCGNGKFYSEAAGIGILCYFEYILKYCTFIRYYIGSEICIGK